MERCRWRGVKRTTKKESGVQGAQKGNTSKGGTEKREQILEERMREERCRWERGQAGRQDEDGEG